MLKKLLLSLLIPVLAFAETPEQVGFLIAGLTDSTNEQLAGGKVYTYSCGTTSNKTTWQDGGKASSHANPIVLDGEGKKLVFADGCYKFRIDDANDVTQYTLDNLRFGLYSGVTTYAGATTGSSNAYVATLTPALLALTDGAKVTFIANHTNTGAATLNVNSLGAKNIYDAEATALSVSTLTSGHTYTVVYNSSQNAWMLVKSVSVSTGSYTPTLTNVTNVAASTAFACTYTKITNTVTVACAFNVDPTAAAPTSTELGISLPIASNLTTVPGDLAGVCNPTTSTTERGASVTADVSNDRAAVIWATADSGDHTMYCVFSYLLK